MVTAAGEGTRQFTVAASKVQDRFAAAQRIDQARHAGLESLAGVGKVRAEVVIEVAVELDQALGRGGIHAVIITGIILRNA